MFVGVIVFWNLRQRRVIRDELEEEVVVRVDDHVTRGIRIPLSVAARSAHDARHV